MARQKRFHAYHVTRLRASTCVDEDDLWASTSGVVQLVPGGGARLTSLEFNRRGLDSDWHGRSQSSEEGNSQELHDCGSVF